MDILRWGDGNGGREMRGKNKNYIGKRRKKKVERKIEKMNSERWLIDGRNKREENENGEEKKDSIERNEILVI